MAISDVYKKDFTGITIVSTIKLLEIEETAKGWQTNQYCPQRHPSLTMATVLL